MFAEIKNHNYFTIKSSCGFLYILDNATKLRHMRKQMICGLYMWSSVNSNIIRKIRSVFELKII